MPNSTPTHVRGKSDVIHHQPIDVGLRVPGELARRARGLSLRGARGRCNHPSCLSQCVAFCRSALRYVDRFGIRTHRFFTSSYSAQELLAARDAIARWARLTYGFMGRTPDYKASFMATLGANPEFYSPFEENARQWYRRFASKALYLNHVLINPPVDRMKPVHEIADVFLHVVRETDRGAIVSGAKMLATGSALTNATFVAHNSAT